jgi:hypothetical protein
MRLNLNMNLDGAYTQTEEGEPDGRAIAGYLRNAAQKIEDGYKQGPIRDEVRKIGEFKITKRTYKIPD